MRRMLARVCASVALTAAAAGAGAAAQAPPASPALPLGGGMSAVCWHPRIVARCRMRVLTELHAMWTAPPAMGPGADADWGVLVSLGRQHGIGAAARLTVNRSGLWFAPTARYERQLGGRTVLDVAVGHPSAGTMEGEREGVLMPTMTASIHLARAGRYGVFVRADAGRRSTYLGGSGSSSSYHVERVTAFSGGGSLDGPGGAVTGLLAGAVVIGLVALACGGGACS